MASIPATDGEDVDLSDLPEGLPATLVEEVRTARLKRLKAEDRKLSAEAEFRHQKNIGQRYKSWALDDTIGAGLVAAFEPRGRPV